ncbi:hypothetical protein CQA49_08965 [Helicobacter sp. MIT 00-7814]|nr:hypothetical protein CQA49_08965 [Helicobacter sp. MIT 00-7814]RDU54129.1 hypothetical protein CQA37_05820 [Helicobacter sp. MIT 99-10781]
MISLNYKESKLFGISILLKDFLLKGRFLFVKIKHKILFVRFYDGVEFYTLDFSKILKFFGSI